MEPRLRYLTRSLDASRNFVGAMVSTEKRSAEEPEPWPRPTRRESRWRIRLVSFALWPLLLALVAAQQLWDARPDSAVAMPALKAPAVNARPGDTPPPASEALPSRPPAAKSAPQPAAAPKQVIHIKARRGSSARFVIDEIELPWRTLKAGDEFFSRPHEKLFIETDDWGSLTATLNGKPVPLGPANNVIRVK